MASLSKRRKWALLCLVLLAGFAAWFFIPREASTRDFDPAVLAQSERQMWQAYYAKDYPALTLHLWSAARNQLGGSPWMGLCIASDAAQAAYLFQKSTSREEAQSALSALESYYLRLNEDTGETFDYQEAARLELEWWQLRREHATEAQISEVLAELYALIYNEPLDAMREPAHLRVLAMQYRDARRAQGLSDAEWATLEAMLLQAYSSLSHALSKQEILT